MTLTAWNGESFPLCISIGISTIRQLLRHQPWHGFKTIQPHQTQSAHMNPMTMIQWPMPLSDEFMCRHQTRLFQSVVRKNPGLSIAQFMVTGGSHTQDTNFPLKDDWNHDELFLSWQAGWSIRELEIGCSWWWLPKLELDCWWIERCETLERWS